MKIIGISGSLRTVSLSTALLNAAATLVPRYVKLVVYDGIGNLPHFNPELDKQPVPPAVSDFRSQLNGAAGVVISTPEYAHGIPGVLKNALDWVVGSGETVDLPIALFNASTRSRYAIESLEEILRTMAGRIIPEACIALPMLGKNPTVNQIVTDTSLATTILSALEAFKAAIVK